MDDRGQLRADEVLGVAVVDPGRRRTDVAEHAAGLGDHDDVAGPLHQGAEVVLLLGQFLGERDVVEEHDRLPEDQGEHDRAAGEDHDPVDPAALHDVVQDAERADRGGQVGRERGEGPGDRAADGPWLRGLDSVVLAAAGAPGGVGEEQGTGEPSRVQQLARPVRRAQQRRREQGVAEHGQGEAA